MLSWKIGGASTSMNKAEPCHNACDTVYLRLSLVEPYGMDIVMVYFGEGAVHIISGYTFGC